MRTCRNHLMPRRPPRDSHPETLKGQTVIRTKGRDGAFRETGLVPFCGSRNSQNSIRIGASPGSLPSPALHSTRGRVVIIARTFARPRFSAAHPFRFVGALLSVLAVHGR